MIAGPTPVRRPPPTPTLRQVTRRDHGVLSDVLARAFYDDPIMLWLVPKERHRYARLKRFFRAELDMYQRHNRIVATADHGAAALWSAPDQWRTSPIDLVRTAPRTLLAFGHRVVGGISLLTAMEKIHPEEPHWYLGVVGADPARKGTGAGKAVISVVLAECDEHGLPAYLESSKEVNISYYERFGFRVTGEVTIPGGPTLHPMWRDPR